MAEGSKGRNTAFRIVLGLFIVASVGFGLVSGAFGLFGASDDIHRFHNYISLIVLTVLLV